MYNLRRGILNCPDIRGIQIDFPRSSGAIEKGILTGNIVAIHENGEKHFDLATLSLLHNLENSIGKKKIDERTSKQKNLTPSSDRPFFTLEVHFEGDLCKNLHLETFMQYNPSMRHKDPPPLVFEEQTELRYKTRNEVKSRIEIVEIREAIVLDFLRAWDQAVNSPHLDRIETNMEVIFSGDPNATTLQKNDQNSLVAGSNSLPSSPINPPLLPLSMQNKHAKLPKIHDNDKKKASVLAHPRRSITRKKSSQASYVYQSPMLTSATGLCIESSGKNSNTDFTSVSTVSEGGIGAKLGEKIAATATRSSRTVPVTHRAVASSAVKATPNTNSNTNSNTNINPKPTLSRTMACHASRMGRRPTMEDEYFIGHMNKWEMYAVYDGHGGNNTSVALREKFGPRLLNSLASQIVDPSDEIAVKKIILDCFLAQDIELHKKWLQDTAVTKTGSTNDDLFEFMNGSCACVLMKNSNYVYVCNLGDSRCILITDITSSESTPTYAETQSKMRPRRHNVTHTTLGTPISPMDTITIAALPHLQVFVTQDHKPSTISERNRIKKNAGFVSMEEGAHRVNGILATSRAFGNFGFTNTYDARTKKQFLTSLKTNLRHELLDNPPLSVTPDITYKQINSGTTAIICCDGIFDVLSNEEVAVLVHQINNGRKACENLVQLAYDKGSQDNLSALVINFEF